jgi:CBS domain containing-hemolysin-like protein
MPTKTGATQYAAHTIRRGRKAPIDTALRLGASALLIVLNALFVVAEFSLVAADRSALDRAAAGGDRRAGRATALLDRLSFHLSGTQMGITVTSVLLGFLAEPAVAAVLDPVLSDPPRAVSVALALVIATVFQMVLGELVPKQVAIAYADRSVRVLAGPIRAYSAVAGPAISHFEGVANRVIRLFGIEPREHLAAGRSREELEWLLRATGEEGGLEPEEVSLLTRSIRFGEKTAADALTPRTSIVAVADTEPVSRFVELALESGYSRLPVYHDDLDDIVGVVHVKSVFGLLPADRPTTPVKSIMTGVLAVPESRDLDVLFADFRNSRSYLAVVVDEHGGTAGILTLEDLLEELVGEIDDEYDEPEPVVEPNDEGPWTLAGGLHRDEVTDACGFLLPDGEFETLAGFVLDELGHIPRPGASVERDGWRFEVVEMDRLRVAAVRVHAPVHTADLPVSGPDGRDLAP